MAGDTLGHQRSDRVVSLEKPRDCLRALCGLSVRAGQHNQPPPGGSRADASLLQDVLVFAWYRHIHRKPFRETRHVHLRFDVGSPMDLSHDIYQRRPNLSPSDLFESLLIEGLNSLGERGPIDEGRKVYDAGGGEACDLRRPVWFDFALLP